MTPQQYIQQHLEELKEFHPREVAKENLAEEIVRLLLSKKFRKYAANEALIEHIKNAVALNIENNQPIKLTFPHGAYKLWRLKEAPLPDWAELFTAMYYTKWLTPICEIYQPGVWFDFYVDDFILDKMNNIPVEDTKAYVQENQNILDFLKQYQPKNLRITITPFSTICPSLDEFENALNVNIEKLSQTNPRFSKEDLEAVELNAHPTPEQLKDPQWKEKVRIIHDAYMRMKREIGYYYKPEKIPVFCQPIASGKFVIVGTTKTSIAKFWVGIGVLKKIADGYIEYILSPKQIKSHTLTKEAIEIKGLASKNFKTINTFS